MDSEKSMNLFGMNKRVSHLIIYETIFFGNFLNFLAFLLCKIYVFDFFNMVGFFRLL